MRRYGLRDDQWDQIKNFLLGRLGTVGVTASDNRRFVEAVLYRYRAGIPWRDLSERFGDWKNVHRPHPPGRKDTPDPSGVLFAHLRQRPKEPTVRPRLIDPPTAR